MPTHFTSAEFAERKQKTQASMAERKLDALLMFMQESMYWLTGYDTFGYCFFQCLILRADGEIVLLTRAPDLRQAQNTSMIEDIRIWVDRDGASPADDLKDLLKKGGLEGKRLGIEYDATGLSAARGKQVDAALDGFALTADASDLVSRLRLVKSEAELAYVRRAAALADDALDAAIAETKAGADEGDILAAMQGAVFKGGGGLSGQSFHHRVRAGRFALPVQIGKAKTRCLGSAHLGVRGRLSTISRLLDADVRHRRAIAP